MPNVPKLPGVPTLSSYASFAVTKLTSDLFAFVTSLFRVRWGVFKGGVQVVFADNVVDVSLKQDFSLANYPIEKGGFESYDKVNSPQEIRVRFSSGGSVATRQSFLQSVQRIADSLDLFDVVTPEAIYPNMNLSHFDYQRSVERGAGIITIDTWWLEIRQTTQADFTNTQAPSGSGIVNGGTVPTTPATSAQQTILGGAH